MTDTGFFKSAGESLSYSCTVPHGGRKAQGVLFVHAGGGNRLGPHRMFVEFARKFNELGYPTFRFDLTGCGDSTGTEDGDAQGEIRDVGAAADTFARCAAVEKLILFGISRGAWISFLAMAQEEMSVAGAVLLSAPVSDGKAAAQAFVNRAKEYVCKLGDAKYLRKLLGGKVNLRQIGRTLLHAANSSQRYESPNISMKSKCPVLLIYGGNDPIVKESRAYYTGRCEENGLSSGCRVIENANHSFFHYKWKEQIFDITRGWLESTIGTNEK